MALTVNTNITSLISQRNLDSATTALNNSLERMSTGYKINHAADNAAGFSIANTWVTQLGSLDVVADNTSTGIDMLTTSEENYGLLTEHLQRVRDLTEQAANGTYGSQSLKAIQAEIASRLQEVNRISATAEFNGIKLMAYTEDGDGSGVTSNGVDLQVGLYGDNNSRIHLGLELFKDAGLNGLFGEMEKSPSSAKSIADMISDAGGNISDLTIENNIQAFAAACASLIYKGDGKFNMQTESTNGAREMLSYIDTAINNISERVTKIGATQNRLNSALTAIGVQSQNITSSLSTLKDADIAEESSSYIRSQILQQASATLLSTANQMPSIALDLI